MPNIIINSLAENIFLQPHNLLKAYIAHYTLSPNSALEESSFLNLIPDASGCIVFTLQNEKLELNFWGPTSKVVQVQKNKAQVQLRFFIEFMPASAYLFTNFSQKECLDLQSDLANINPKLHKKLREAFWQAKDYANFISTLDHILLNSLEERKNFNLMQAILKTIQQTNTLPSIELVAKTLNYSPRQLNRVSQEMLGMSLKSYLRIFRINKTIQTLQKDSHKLTIIAQNEGFYDQAHFIHDFQNICGLSPSQYLKNMSDFYNEPFKFKTKQNNQDFGGSIND